MQLKRLSYSTTTFMHILYLKNKELPYEIVDTDHLQWAIYFLIFYNKLIKDRSIVNTRINTNQTQPYLVI